MANSRTRTPEQREAARARAREQWRLRRLGLAKMPKRPAPKAKPAERMSTSVAGKSSSYGAENTVVVPHEDGETLAPAVRDLQEDL
jgi:hypothetical protein